jgi:hypothetical protein
VECTSEELGAVLSGQHNLLTSVMRGDVRIQGALAAAKLLYTFLRCAHLEAEGDAGYNPIGYHVGTVWPHDNSIIAWGLRRCGYRAEAAKLALAMLEAATSFRGRLPEAFAGYPRALTGWPVEYPTACSPQAWATAAPMLLCRTLLGLEPVGGRLLVDPALPEGIERIELLDIPGRWGRADAFGRGRIPLGSPPLGTVS